MNTPDRVLAERFEKKEVEPDRVVSTLDRYIGDNDRPLRLLEDQADCVISGESNQAEQLSILQTILKD